MIVDVNKLSFVLSYFSIIVILWEENSLWQTGVYDVSFQFLIEEGKGNENQNNENKKLKER